MWDLDQVAARFEEAARTAHRLPPVRVQGYFNSWPAIARERWESYADPARPVRFPPDPAAIDRMEETWCGCGPRDVAGRKSAPDSAVTAPPLGGVGAERWGSLLGG